MSNIVCQIQKQSICVLDFQWFLKLILEYRDVLLDIFSGVSFLFRFKYGREQTTRKVTFYKRNSNLHEDGEDSIFLASRLSYADTGNVLSDRTWGLQKL